MSSRIVRAHTEAEIKTGLRSASRVITSGGLVAFPTESFYGLGVNATDEGAIQHLLDVKERGGDHLEASPLGRCRQGRGSSQEL